MNGIIPRRSPCRAFALAAACLAFALPALAQPVNDNFANAIEIFGGWGVTNGFDTAQATGQLGEPAHAGSSASHSIWFKWVAEKDGPVTFDTFGSDFDTVLAVYAGIASGTNVQNLSMIGANDFINLATSNVQGYPAYWNPSVITVNARAGATYYIAVDGYGGDSGNASLAWAYLNSGVFRFTLDGYQVSETDGATTGRPSTSRSILGARITVTRMGGAVGRASVDITTADLTAADGTDYSGGTGTLVFDHGEMSKSFSVPLTFTADNCTEDPLVFTVELTNPRRDDLEADVVSQPRIDPDHSLCGVIIQDWVTNPAEIGGSNTPPCATQPMVNFERSNYRCLESVGTVEVRVYRFGPLDDGIEIHYSVDSTRPIDANYLDNSFQLQAGSEYATPTPTNEAPATLDPTDFDATGFLNSGTLSWGAGDGNPKIISIPINDDGTPEFNEDLRIKLFQIPGHDNDAFIGNIAQATVTILFDDYPAGAVDESYNQDNVLTSEPPVNPYPGANAGVNALAIQPDQKTVIGGTFSSYNGYARAHIARVGMDGRLDPAFNPGSGFANALDENPASVNALVLDPANRILAGGYFSSYNGSARLGIARINPNGSLDGTFNPGLGTTNPVWAVALQTDGKVLVAGEFTTFNGTDRLRIVRLNADGSVDPTFNPGTNGPNGTIYALGLQPDGRMVIAGAFSTVGGQPRAAIARLLSDGTLDASFNPGAGLNDSAYALAVQTDGKILVGGEFTIVDTFELNSLARLNSDGSVDQEFDPGTGANDTIYNLTLLPDGRFYIGGRFTSFNGTHRINLARLLPSGYVDTSFLDTAYNQYAGFPTFYYNPDINSATFVLASGVQSDGKVIVGGNFQWVGGGRLAASYFGGPAIQTNLWELENYTRSAMRSRLNLARLLDTPTIGPGNLGFTSTNYNVNENGSLVFVLLNRENGTLGIMGASFHLPERAPGIGVARAGTDFSFAGAGPLYYSSHGGPPNTRRWSDGIFGANNIGETVIGGGITTALDDVVLSILNNSQEEPDRNSSMVMDVPLQMDTLWLGGENMPLGTALARSSAFLSIIDDDRRPGEITFAAPNYLVNENAGFAAIQVIRTNGSSGVISCQYTTTNNYLAAPSATIGSDYIPTNGVITFRDGQTSTNFFVRILDNSVVEPDETINLRLLNPSGGIPGNRPIITASNAVLYVIDDDFKAGHVNFSAPVYKTNEAAGTAIATITRSGGNAGAVSIDVVVSAGSNAVPYVDFIPATNTVTWNSGESTPKNVPITILNNDVVDPTTSLLLALRNPSTNGLIGNVQSNAVVVVENDDFFGQVEFAASAFYVKENGGAARITVTRLNGAGETVTINFGVNPITAQPNVNYLPVSGTLTFGPGIVSRFFDVPVIDNPTQDGNVTLALQLSGVSPAGSLGLPSTAILTIVDEETYNEPAGSVDTSFDTSIGFNGDIFGIAVQNDRKIVAGGDFSSFNNVTRTRLARLDAATGSLDPQFLPAGTGPNATVRAIVNQIDDRLLIGGAFTAVSSVVRNGIARLNYDGSIDTSFNPGSGTDNPVLAIAETFVAGGTNGLRRIIIGGGFTTVNSLPRGGVARLNDDGAVDTTFNIGQGANGTVFSVAVYPTNSIQAGKIIIGGDFLAFNGTARTRIARLNADGSLDPTFNPGLGANDLVRAVAIQSDGKVLLGGAFTTVNGLPFNRVARLNLDGSVDGSFNLGAGANDSVYAITIQGDQRILVAGEFSRCNGVTRNRLTRLLPDGTTDPEINFGGGANNFVASLALQPDTNAGPRIMIGGGFTQFNGINRGRIARLYGGSLTGMGAFEFSAPAYAASEAGTNVTVTIKRQGGTAGPLPGGSVTVLLTTQDQTAIAGLNYLGVTNTVTFPLGETVMNVNIPLIDDPEVNSNRTFLVNLSNPQPDGGPILGGQPFAEVTIISDDSAVSFTSPTYSRAENAIDGVATITLQRIGYLATTSTVEFDTTPFGTAVIGVNYLPVHTTVVFQPNDAFRTVKIPLINNTLIEGDRTVTLALRDPVGAYLLSPSSAVLTIVEDDQGPGRLSFSATNYVVIEANTNAVITILRTNGWTGIVSAQFSTSPGTAVPLADYLNVTNSVVFADGETNKTVSIPIFDDPVVDGTKTVNLFLKNPTGGATLGTPSTSLLTILDNDVALAFSTPVFVVSEGAGSVTLNVLRLNGTNGITTVNFATTNGTALAGQDFTAVSGLLTFNPGESFKTISIPILQDTLIEGDETFSVRLFNPSPNVQLADPSTATVVILDDDTGFFFISSTLQVLENAANAVITVMRTNVNTGTCTVSFSTEDGTATAGVDYQPVTGTLTFTNGVASQTFLVPIVDDTLAEGDETFTVSLSAPSAGASLLAPSTQTVTIVDNDAGLRFSSPTYSVLESGVKATITVQRTNFTASTVSVNYATQNGTATAGSDYTPVSGTLVFTNGETSKSFDVFILDDTLIEGDETVLLNLSNPVGNAALLSPNAATLTIIDDDGSDIKAAGVALVSESNVPANGVLETNETVTLWFALRDALGTATTNLVATLLSTNGVTLPSGPQSYGVLQPGGASASRQFTFTAVGTNGGPVVATFNLRDGSLNLGQVVFNFTLGTSAATFSNVAPVTIRDNTSADPYPSTINISGLAGSVVATTITLSNLTHAYVGDVDSLLTGPAGTNVVFFSDAGSVGVNNLTLTFSDSATNTIPLSGIITNGTYRPVNIGPDNFVTPAPGAPYGATMSVFNGSNPNGNWSLFIMDDSGGDVGAINGGWFLKLTVAHPIVPSADLSIAVTDAPDPVIVSSNITYTVSVTNFGPGAATSVVVTDPIPAGAQYVSAGSGVGSVATNAGAVVWTVGGLAKDASATLTVVLRPTAPGTLTNVLTIAGASQDLNPGNNVAAALTTVSPASADLALGMTDAPDPVFVGATVTFSLSITNFGPATATSVAVTNVLPAGYAYLTNSSASQGSVSASGQSVTASLGNLGAGGRATVSIVARALVPETYTNSASVASTAVDPLKANNTAAVKNVVQATLLTTTVVGGNLLITFPNSSELALYATASLTPPVAWLKVNTASAPVVNGYKQVTVPIGPGSRFYMVGPQ